MHKARTHAMNTTRLAQLSKKRERERQFVSMKCYGTAVDAVQKKIIQMQLP